MKHTTTLRRFGSREIDTANAVGLRADHPAVVDGRTLFPSTVVGSMESPRFLVSGHNNPKLGKEVLKGDRKGWPIFHLTLEERATCPRSCEQWLTCFGNAMPQARRHAVDDVFLPLLRGEIATLARANPKGLLIRLHALGDFYSAEYVLAWAEMLAQFPQVAVFGYTARRTDDPDPASAKIAQTIKVMTDAMWARFAIRTSASDPIARSRSTVVLEDPQEPDTIVCPAQTGGTEACASCGLCWSESARDKTIAFLKHGMTNRRGGARPALAAVQSEAAQVLAPVASRETPALAAASAAPGSGTVPQKLARRILEAAPELFAKHPGGVLIADVMKAVGSTYNHTTVALSLLDRDGLVAWIKFAPGVKYKCMRPAGSVEPEVGLTEHQATILNLLWKASVDGVVAIDRPTLRRDSGLQMMTVDLCVSALRRKGFTEWMAPPPSDLKHAYYRLLRRGPYAAPPTPTQPAPMPSSSAPAVLKAPARPKESVLWEKAEPVARKPARAIPATDCPAEPAPAPARAPQAETSPVAPNDDDMALLWPPGSLLALRHTDCRWPLNAPAEGAGHLTMFCAAVKAGEGPYCSKHDAAAHGRRA